MAATHLDIAKQLAERQDKTESQKMGSFPFTNFECFDTRY